MIIAEDLNQIEFKLLTEQNCIDFIAVIDSVKICRYHNFSFFIFCIEAVFFELMEFIGAKCGLCCSFVKLVLYALLIYTF